MTDKFNQLELFKLFCGSDSNRPVMFLPFEVNEKIYATDAMTLICCDKKHLEFELTNKEKPLAKVEKVFPEINSNRIVANKMEDFDVFKTRDLLMKNGKDIKCDTCNGDGEVEWEYEHHTKIDDCPVCRGIGYSYEAKTVPTGEKTFERDVYVKIDDANFNVNVFMVIFEAQKMIGEEIVLLNKVEKYKPALFKIGKYQILIMPVGSDEKPLLKISFIDNKI